MPKYTIDRINEALLDCSEPRWAAQEISRPINRLDRCVEGWKSLCSAAGSVEPAALKQHGPNK